MSENLTCSAVNRHGFKCPRTAVEDGVCNHHLTVVPVPVAVPIPVAVAVLDDNRCHFITQFGDKCHQESSGDSVYCRTHRCKHGKSTFRGDYHCRNPVVVNQEYCLNHQNSCDCYCFEDDTGFGICHEDIQQCDKPLIITEPMRLCQFHHQLFLFEEKLVLPL